MLKAFMSFFGFVLNFEIFNDDMLLKPLIKGIWAKEQKNSMKFCLFSSNKHSGY